MASSEATHHRRSATGGGGASVSDDSDDDQSWHSMSESGNVQRKSCESDCPVEEVDLVSGVLELKKVMHLSKDERNCRICHLGLEGAVGPTLALGPQLTWGRSCKGDLGAAHKQCAETWFKIKGDTPKLLEDGREVHSFDQETYYYFSIQYPDSNSSRLQEVLP